MPLPTIFTKINVNRYITISSSAYNEDAPRWFLFNYSSIYFRFILFLFFKIFRLCHFLSTFKKEYLGKASLIRQNKTLQVRGVAKNPIDHPNGGRTRGKNSFRTPWGLIARKNK